jgi:hypothetical protein
MFLNKKNMKFILLKKSFKRLICVSIIFFSFVVSAQAQNNALDFDGTNDYVNLGDNAFDFGNTSFTLEVKFKTSSASGERVLFGKDGFCYFNGYFARVENDNKIHFYVSALNAGGTCGDTSKFAVAATSATVNDGNWHTASFVVDRTNDLELSIYIDGVYDVTGSNTRNTGVTSSDNITNGESLGLGAINHYAESGENGTYVQGGLWSNYFTGQLDEFRVWNTARTQTEIQTNMNTELTTATGLVANYHFNQGTAGGNNSGVTSLTDSSGNSNNGTLTNFALTGATSNWVTSGVSFPTPVISSFTPTSAGPGATITLTGTNLTGASAVSFGGTPASSFTVVSSTSITAVVGS